jgi:sortase A
MAVAPIAPQAPTPDVGAPTRLRRSLRALAAAAVVVGVLAVTDAALTVVWQEPLTSLISRLHQRALDGQLERLEHAGPTRAERRRVAALPDRTARLTFLAASLRHRTKDGQAVGRLRIPAIGTSMVVVKGAQGPDLRKGPGFYDRSPFPGQHGTVAIAGHRTTYLAPFRHLDRLHAGDAITVRMPYATFHYRVQRRRIVSPKALWVLGRRHYDRLILSACHPLFSAAQRIVVFARMEGVSGVAR